VHVPRELPIYPPLPPGGGIYPLSNLKNIYGLYIEMESNGDFWNRVANLSIPEQHHEIEKRDALKKQFKEQIELQEKQAKHEKYVRDMVTDPLYLRMQVETAFDKEKIEADIEKLKTKIIVALGQSKATHSIDTAADEFMLAKWEADRAACLASWDRTIQSQTDQIQQMRQAFESKILAIESNLEGTRNSKEKKEAYYNARIKSVQDRIDAALQGHKTPAVIKMELELHELEAKRATYSKKIAS